MTPTFQDSSTVRQFRQLTFSICVAVAAAANVQVIKAADWPGWRGPNRDGVSTEKTLLTQWPSGGPQVRWKAGGLGIGYSSVAVKTGRVFTVGRHGDKSFAYAIDEQTGDELWRVQLGSTTRIPCSTPIVDDDRVYVLDPDGDLVCLNVESGKINWRRQFLDEFAGRLMSGRGYGETVLIDGNRLICTPGGPEAMFAALDKHTGKTIWQSKVPSFGEKGRDGAAFSSIVLSNGAGVRQYVQLLGRGLCGVAADDGRYLWGYNRISNQTVNIPTPVVFGDYVFSANGYNSGSVLLKLKPDGKGGVDAEEVYFLNGSRFQNHHGGYLRFGEVIFGGHGSNNGLPTCVDFKTGKIRWKRRGPGTGSAAIMYADGHLYFRYQNGVMALIKASPDGYQLKSSFQIPGAGGDSWAHPVVANGKLLLRENDNLWVYSIRRVKTNPARVAGKTNEPERDPAVIALRKQRVTLDFLGQISSNALDHPYYRFARTESDEKQRLVTLSNEHLSKNGTITDSILQQLQKLEDAFVLNLAGTHVADAGIEQLTELKKIRGLNLDLCTSLTNNGLQSLPKLTELRVLVLSGTEITDEGLEHLVSAKSLAAIDLEICESVLDDGMKHLGQISSLRAINLGKTGFEPKKISVAGFQHLKPLQELTSLDIHGNSVDDSTLSVLNQFPNLRELDLSRTAVTDKGLPQLGSLKNLESLTLVYSVGFAGPMVTDAGLPHLKQIKSLNSLNLIGAKIGDNGLKQLHALTKLKYLALANTNVTDAGVRELQSALKEIRVRR